jgi:hypothetical protein
VCGSHEEQRHLPFCQPSLFVMFSCCCTLCVCVRVGMQARYLSGLGFNWPSSGFFLAVHKLQVADGALGRVERSVYLQMPLKVRWTGKTQDSLLPPLHLCPLASYHACPCPISSSFQVSAPRAQLTLQGHARQVLALQCQQSYFQSDLNLNLHLVMTQGFESCSFPWF